MTAIPEVSEEVSTFKEHLKTYIIYKIEDEKIIVVEKIGASGASHDDFVNDLTGDEKASQCRYGLCDFRYVSDGTDGMDVGMNVSKRVLIVWKPDTAKIKEKMLYQVAFDTMALALQKESGVGKYIEATDTSECSKEALDKKVR